MNEIIALSKRLCKIQEVMDMAKKIKDKTGELPIPHDTYLQLKEERIKIRQQLDAKTTEQ